MSIIQSIILGLIQGITEFLPVSSSGHLVLIPYLLSWPQQSLAFDVMVHMGTLGAILLYFQKEVKYLAKTSVTVTKRIISDPQILLNIDNFNGDRLPVILLIGTVPVAIAGLVLGDKLADKSESPLVIAAMLILVGLLMWFIDKRSKPIKKLANIDFYDALMVGASQALALIKGTSRSGITIAAGRHVGYSIKDAAKLSFLLSIPAVGLAGAYKLFQLIGNPNEIEFFPMLIGLLTSFGSGYFAIRFLFGILEKKGIKPFIYYRIALGTIIIIAYTASSIISK